MQKINNKMPKGVAEAKITAKNDKERKPKK